MTQRQSIEDDIELVRDSLGLLDDPNTHAKVSDAFERVAKLTNSYRAALQTTPKGWKLVPIIPTDDMVRAAYRKTNWQGTEFWMTDLYEAMLDAAPEVPND